MYVNTNTAGLSIEIFFNFNKKSLTKHKPDNIMAFVDERKVSTFGILAQLGEHLPYKQRVTGSSPVGPIRGGIAQLARARGSYPRCRGFESPSRY